MSKHHKTVNVIMVDDQYLSSVFTGIKKPISEWSVNTTDNEQIAMIHRPYDATLYNMLPTIFPMHKFSLKQIQKYKPCGCSFKDEH